MISFILKPAECPGTGSRCCRVHTPCRSACGPPWWNDTDQNWDLQDCTATNPPSQSWGSLNKTQWEKKKLLKHMVGQRNVTHQLWQWPLLMTQAAWVVRQTERELTGLLLLFTLSCFHFHPAGPSFDSVHLVKLRAGRAKPNTACCIRSRPLASLNETQNTSFITTQQRNWTICKETYKRSSPIKPMECTWYLKICC